MKCYILYFIFVFLWCNQSFGGQSLYNDMGIDEAQSIMHVVLCNIISLITGSVAQAISAIVIVIMGYSLFIGKISVAMFFVTGAGIMLVFGAQEIVDMITNGSMMDNLHCN